MKLNIQWKKVLYGIIVIHPFVFGLIPCLSKVMDGMYNIVNDPEIFILEIA